MGIHAFVSQATFDFHKSLGVKDHFCLILFGQTFDPSVQISDGYQTKYHQLTVHYLAYDIPADINKVVKICNYKKFIKNQKALIISKLTV